MNYPKAYLYQRIVQAKLYIDEHYHEEPDLDEIAGTACFSKYHFIRLFKGAYGCTPHQYLTRVRIARAKELLRQGVPVADTCYRLGFASTASFVGLFKRYTLISPGRFRLNEQQRALEMSMRPTRFVPNCFLAR